ncbi:MAG: hypothetical protein JSS89_12075 [Bacteroidetes bacterium]|nr:hypothetical protein [Bacteroidota bacterium]
MSTAIQTRIPTTASNAAPSPHSPTFTPAASTESDFWRDIGSLVVQMPEDRATELREIAMWLHKLRMDLWQARRIATEWSRLTWMFAELVRTDFSAQRFDAAETWILRGAWHPKKTFLTLDDFFPTAYQLDKLCGAGIITLESHRKHLAATAKAAYEAGVQEGRENVAKEIPSVEHGTDAAALIDAERRKATMAMLEAASEKADLVEENRRLCHELEKMRRRVDTLQAELAALRLERRSTSAEVKP